MAVPRARTAFAPTSSRRCPAGIFLSIMFERLGNGIHGKGESLLWLIYSRFDTAEPVVKPPGNVTGQFEMLALVFSYRYSVGLVQENIRRLEKAWRKLDCDSQEA